MPDAHEGFGRQAGIGAQSKQNRFICCKIVDEAALKARGSDRGPQGLRIQARLLQDMGCVAVMPLASLIGSGMGILNPWNLQLILERLTVPVIVDAGVGTASDAAIAMELGCAGVLMNTAVALAREPVRMAGAMKKAVEAGREAYLAGRMPKKLYTASASSPNSGLISAGKA